MLPSINRSHSTDKPRPLLFTDRSHSSSTIADDRLDTDRSDHDDEYTDPNHPGSWVHHKDTLWGQCVQVISKRPKGWMKRFAENLDETMIHESEKSADEKRWERFASTGWKNITLSADSITPPKIIQRKEKYSKYPDSGLRTINCTYCFRVVAQGAEFIPCERCDLIAHIGCIPNVSKFSKRQLEKNDTKLSDAGIRRSFIRSSGIAKISTNSATSSVGENSPDSKKGAISGRISPDSTGSTFMSGSNSRRTSNNNGVPPLLTKGILAGDQEYRPQTAPAILVKDEFVAKDILWLCEFCEKEIKINQIYYEKKQERDIENYKKLLSCLRLQSFFRMVYDRIRFRKFRRGIIAFQQMIRMRKFAQLAEIDRLNQTYLYKIRFHELKIFTLDPVYSGNPSVTSLGGHTTTLGDAFITSSPSSSLMNHVPPFPTHKYPYLIGKLNSTKFERCLNYYLNRQQQQQQNHHQTANNATGIQVAMNMIKQQNNLGSKSGTIKRPGKEASQPPDSPLTDMKGHHEAGKTFYNFSDETNPNPGSSAGGISSLFPFLTKEDDEKDRELLELIFLGGGTSINNHSHHHSLENPQYAKPYRDMQILLKGTLFLTVTVLEHHVEDITSVDQGTSHQVFANVTSTQAVINLLEHNMNDPLLSAFIQTYRYDLLLKSTGQGLKCRPSFLQKLGFNNTTNEFLDPSVMEKLCKYYLLDTYTTSKPYLLIPYSHANVTIKFTLSEVLDWPKAQVLGQSFFHPQHFIIRKKIISVHQCLQLSYKLKPDDLPLPEEGGKIILQMPKNYSTLSSNYQNNRNNNRNNNSSGRTNGLSKAEKNKIPKDFQKEMIVEQARQLLSSSGAAGAGSKRRGTKHDANGEMVQSMYPMITWTLFAPYKHDGQEFGYLMILNPESATSIKKKYWCVLTDKLFLIYNIVRESAQIKFEIDLRYSYLSLLPTEDLFRIRHNSDTLFCQGFTLKEHETWFKKLYTLSLSHTSVPFHIYMRRKNAILKSSFNTRGNHSTHETHTHSGNDLLTALNTTLNQSGSYSPSHQGSGFVSRAISLSKSRSGDNDERAAIVLGGQPTRRGNTAPESNFETAKGTPALGTRAIRGRATTAGSAIRPTASGSVLPNGLRKPAPLAIPLKGPKGSMDPRASIHKSRSSAASPVTPSGRIPVIHNGMHNSIHGKKSIHFSSSTDIQAAAAAAVAFVNSLGGANAPFHARRISTLEMMNGKNKEEDDEYSKLTDEEKHDRMVLEVDDIVQELKEKHSLENALNAKKYTGKFLVDTFASSVIHSRALF